MSNFGSLDFTEVLGHADKLGAGSQLATLTALLLFMGAMGKSAQLPLHVWLPDAMEGPTPVSALIHAATMVTAGVYMVARCHAIFELSPVAMQTIAWIGGITALFAASIALVQNDIKRVMAYSTLSQLGYMVMGVGVGAYTAGFFHLFTHAFFKALLFLGCGSVMHALHGELDMTKMGGLRKKLPITHATVLIGALCLAGVPGTSGFFSKDAILYEALAGPFGNPALWAVGALTAVFTAFYVGRFIFKTFYGETRLDHHTFDHAHESGPAMAIPLVILAALALGVGFLGMPRFMSQWQPFSHWLEPVFADVHRPELPENVGLSLKLIAFYTSAIAFMAWLTWRWFAKPSPTPNAISAQAKPIHTLLWNKYYVDELYQAVFVDGFLRVCKLLWLLVDQGLIDGAVNLFGWAAQRSGEALRLRVQNGQVRLYAGALLLGAVILLGLVLGLAPR